MNKTNGFAISWFFAPYIGSADIDFYKRIKNTNIDYLVAQVAREIKDDRLLRCPGNARIERVEIRVDHKNPRTVSAREKFCNEVLRILRPLIESSISSFRIPMS